MDSPTELTLNTSGRQSFNDVTALVEDNIQIESGIVLVYVPHTTCALVINEGFDPDVMRDLENHLNHLVPEDGNFLHAEGNSDAHIKSMLLGNSVQLIVREGKLVLGTWERIVLCDFDGPRRRRLLVQQIGL